MIDQKVKGQEITVAPPAPERGRGKVVDIFAALKQSLEQAGAQNRPATRERTAKAGRKRTKGVVEGLYETIAWKNRDQFFSPRFISSHDLLL